MKTIGPSKSPGRVPCGRFPIFILVTACSLLLSACANTYEMKVDALSRPKLEEGSSYKIVNRNPTIESDSLRYKEVEKAVKVALSGKGMYEAPDEAKADVIINLDYGINPPEIAQEMHSQPLYIEMPGQTRTETVQIGTDRQGNPVYSVQTVTDPPTTEYAGEEEYPVFVVTYEKYLKLSARENQPATADESKPPKEIWAVDVTSKGTSSNLRKYIPIMAAATIGYIGKDTSGEKNVKLKDDKGSDVAFVKKGL